MKRKWIWTLAALLMVAGFIWAKRLADKRPRLVAHDFKISGVTISPNGKTMIARGELDAEAQAQSRVISLEDGSQVSISGDINSKFFFSPDSKNIYQLDTTMKSEQPPIFCNTLVAHDAATGHFRGQFRFACDAQLYGVAWRNGEVVAESARQTWHFEPRTLHLIRTQKQNRAHIGAILCPDGETICWQSGGDELGETPVAWNFSDLGTGKILWKEGPKLNPGVSLGFSVDGRTILWSGGTEIQKSVVARDIRTGIEKWGLDGPQGWDLALSPDESAIYEARQNGELWKWPR